uniref:Uncharacterized protein n=1 Tax=Arundo donax TaxID=35708 RepID=A0A0A8Z068_ARUDO
MCKATMSLPSHSPHTCSGPRISCWCSGPLATWSVFFFLDNGKINPSLGSQEGYSHWP